MCTTNDNHMMYSSWDMKHDRQNFLSFWTVFCHFTPLATWKIKILKKWKKSLEILSIYTSVSKIMIYAILFLGLVRDRCNCYFSFTLLSKKWKFQKNEKNMELSSFYTSVPKIKIIWYAVPEIWHVPDVIDIFHFGLFFALLPP